MNDILSLNNIYWREPLWLLLALQPFIIVLFKKVMKQSKHSRYAEKSLQAWVVFPSYHSINKYTLIKNISYLVAWLLFSVSLSGPRVPLSQTDKEQLFGANIMLVIDLSRSMQATDISPNRLRRAKIEVYEFLNKAKDHKVGITVFSARPHLFVPLTSDHAVLKKYLESIEELSFPTLGSDPVSAIQFAQNELNKIKGKSAIVMLTDGDFPDMTQNKLKNLQQANIPLYILGVGSSEGEAVQLKDGTWLKHEQQDIVSRMNEANLINITKQLNGSYSPLYDNDTDWNTLYDQGISHYNSFSKNKLEKQIVWLELFSYFLFPSLLLFWFSLTRYRLKISNNILLFSLTFSICAIIPDNNAYAIEMMLGQTDEQSAYRAYTKKEYAIAEKLYQNITGYSSYIGQANSLYKMGHYQKAISKYVLATLSAENNSQRTNSLYNLANSYYRTGDFSAAINTYQDVLHYQPKHTASLHNIKVSKILKKNIERRLKESEKVFSTSRQGKGPRSASIAEGTDISDNTSISSNGNENSPDKDIPLPTLPDLSNDEVKKLILSGLKNIKLAEQGQARETINNNAIQSVDLLRVQQLSNIIRDDQHLLWKRLFEMEEGFPAPVAEPKTLPGFKPW